MNLWESLLLSGAGGALTLLGTWVGFQVQAREQRKVRSEQIARDNLLRLHAERVAGYTAFYHEGGAMRAALHQLAKNPDDDKTVAEAWQQRNALWSACARVTLIGSQPAASKAWELLDYATDAIRGDVLFERSRYRKLIWDFVLTGRADLIFPEDPDTPLSRLWSPPDRSSDVSSAPPETAQVDLPAPNAHVDV